MTTFPADAAGTKLYEATIVGDPRAMVLIRAQTIGSRFAALIVAAITSLAALLVAPSAVAAAGPATALAFEVQPGGGPALAPWPRQPVIRVVDTAGDTVTSSTIAVRLTTADTSAVIGCDVNPVRAVKGMATFTGCIAGEPRLSFRLRATAYRLDAAMSDPFNVGGPAPTSTAFRRTTAGSCGLSERRC